MIKPGIKIYFDEGIVSTGRIALNTGTFQSGASQTQNYCEGSLLPNQDWYIPSSNEFEILLTSSPLDLHNSISVISIPKELLISFHQFEIEMIAQKELWDTVLLNDGFQHLVSQIEGFVSRFLISTDGFVRHDVSVGRSGLLTSTFDPVSNCYVGLHLDDWDELPLSKRINSSNRICINLGREPRNVLFVNLDVLTMIHLMSLTEEERSFYEVHPGQIGFNYLTSNPNYPVVKLTINPGEAYIAPTESIIHDGSTLFQTAADVTLTFRGFFNVKAS